MATIAAGSPFLETLADSYFNGSLIPGFNPLSNPLLMHATTIFLPTRRAAKTLSALFAERANPNATLLPNIIPLGDADLAENNLLFSGYHQHKDMSDFRAEADPLFRRLMLAQLIMKWTMQIRAALIEGKGSLPFSPQQLSALRNEQHQFIPATTPHDALALADALGQLIDTLSIHGKSWEDLHKEIPQDLDQHWLISRHFVAIAVEQWPKICEEFNVVDAAFRRHKLVLAEAERLKQLRPNAPFIVAGSTGSMPATAMLIAAIAGLPNGVAVLPGLDLRLDEASWSMVSSQHGEAGHPQFLLAHLLSVIGIKKEDVVSLGAVSPPLRSRQILISEAMRPVATTQEWRNRAVYLPDEDIHHALESVALIEAEDEREEALAIALSLREVLETENKTAGLITPDRGLAERVSQELARWSIKVEDSAGLTLDRSQSGRLVRLLAGALAGHCSAASLLGLLDHPMVVFGYTDETFAPVKAALELCALRGLSPAHDLAGYRVRLKSGPGRYPKQPEKRITHDNRLQAMAMLDQIGQLFTPFWEAYGKGQVSLNRMVLDLEPLLTGLVGGDGSAFEQSEGSREWLSLVDDIRNSGADALMGSLEDLPGYLEALMAGRMVARHGPTHARIRIWGLLEARLMHADRVVLGGCDESVWPPATQTDPFLSRPIAQALELPSPERRIGQTAHDFCQGFGAPEVVITRASKRGGDPMVRSRFLQRLIAVSGEQAVKEVRARGRVYLDWARALNQPLVPLASIERPAPSPPRDLMPQGFRITDIETLRRDPYALYAREILRLDPLEPLDRPINAADRGTAIHDALGNYTKAYPLTPPANPRETLLDFGRKAFSGLASAVEYETFWWPRYCQTVDWFLAWDAGQRQDGRRIHAEIDGALSVPLAGGGEVSFRGRADRIEHHPDTSFSVLDYKTGAPPSVKQVRAGLTPQLTLTAALVMRGGFPAIQSSKPNRLDYIKLNIREGGQVKAMTTKLDNEAVEALVNQHWHGTLTLINALFNQGLGFAARLHPKNITSVGDYDHLSRVKEWSVGGDDEVGDEASEDHE